MREILFKGKRTDNQQWVEGFYALVGEENPNAYIITSKGRKIRVAHRSISQYTGIDDSNGKKIFENDIVKEGCNGLAGVIIWCNSLGTYRIANFGEDYTIKDAPFEWEVIGNIHDNPELLKGGEG